MSRAHDGQRPFLPFGNPFKRIFPRDSYPSKELLHLQKFEEALVGRFEKLSTKDFSDMLSSAWMALAVKSLCETHTDIKSLITDLKFPVACWDDKWMNVYLDNSVKILDICNNLNSELSRLDQSQLLLKFIVHLLGQGKLEQARGPLHEWMEQCYSNNTKLNSALPIIKDLAASLHPSEAKNSAKGKVLMQAMYGLKVHTIFVCSVVLTILSRSNDALVNLPIFEKFLWVESFNNLQANVNRGIKTSRMQGRVATLKELELVHHCVGKLVPLTDDCVGCDKEEMQKKVLQENVKDLSENAERLSDGLNHLEKQVGQFFQTVMSGRDALLCNLRRQMKENSL